MAEFEFLGELSLSIRCPINNSNTKMQTKYRSKPIFNLAPIVCCKHSAKLSYTSHHNKKKKDETKNHRIAAPTAELELSQIPTF